MGSPEKPNKSTTDIVASTTSSQSAAFQDSPIFNYISNLSPIKPVKGTSVIQGFPGLNSPPLVFTSPRINTYRQSIDLRRSQCHVSTQSELSGQDETGKHITTGAAEPERTTSHMSSELNPHNNQEHGNNSSRHDKTGRPSGCVDDYLADLLEMVCADFTPSANSSMKQSQDGPPKVANAMSPEGFMEKHDNEDDKRNIVMALGESPTFVEQEKEDDEGNLSSHPRPVKNDGKSGRSCLQSNFNQKVQPDISVDDLSVQKYDQRVAQFMQPVFEHKHCGKRIGSGVANKPISTMMVGQSQIGKRRRLQFEEAQEKFVENDPISPKPSSAVSNSEALDFSCADIPSTPRNIQLTGSTQSACPLTSSQNTGISSQTVTKPSGIGLHLNSIVNAKPLAYARPLACAGNVSIKPTEGNYLKDGGEKSTSISSQVPDNMQCPSTLSNSNLAENVLAGSDEYAHETPPSCPSYSDTKSVKIIEHQENSDKGHLNSEQADRVDEFDRSNPKKKRKKTESTGDGCKRCNCKKTKCLKLYCDCFAAGIYCAEPCSCQGCFNRPEYEDTVLETRQQIESRNPLAFAPKIVHRLTQPQRSQSGEDGDQLTPLAGRHKRGCNCKKSMCLKKYCECYQANVGCSDGCRCEGCQNIYGEKGVYGMHRVLGGMGTINENFDSFDRKLKMGSIRPGSSLQEFHKPHNLTPQTPSFQCSDHGKDASKARVFPGRYLPSPESDCMFYPPYVSTPRSPRDSAGCDMITETSNDNLEIVPFDQESYPNVEFMDEFSPGCPTSSNATTHLTSTTDWPNSSRAQLLPPSSVGFSSVSSLRFRGSPVTPVTLFGGSKPTDTKQKPIDTINDDTPNILKDPYIQLNKVKVTSPNKKRVSPPKIRLHELGSSSLKSGRKFILKAVPSFPPLTPCIDSKDGTGQNSNDPPGGKTL